MGPRRSLPRRPVSAGKPLGSGDSTWEPPRFQLDMHRQQVTIDPFSLPFSGGQLHLAPQIRMRNAPVLVMDPGLFGEKLEVTPSVCHSWLKYVAPVLADATRAEGQFSVTLDELRVPLSQPTAARISGKLAIHRRVSVPAHSRRSILNVARQIQTIADPQRAAAGVLIRMRSGF